MKPIIRLRQAAAPAARLFSVRRLPAPVFVAPRVFPELYHSAFRNSVIFARLRLIFINICLTTFKRRVLGYSDDSFAILLQPTIRDLLI